MSKFKALSIIFVGAAVFAVIAGAVVFRAVTATAPDESGMIGRSVRQQADSSTANLPEFDRPDPGGGLPRGYTNEDLANALSITVEELEAAYQTAQNAALDQAVEAGTITQAQADSLRENGFAYPFGGRWGGWLSESGIDHDALLAEALGISQEDLQAANTTAFETRIDQAVADGNLTEEEAELMKGRRALFSSEGFTTTMQTAFEDAVNQAVDAGVITQAQADLILENAAQFRGGDMGIPGFGGPEGFGRGGGHHGWGERMPGGPTAPDQPSTSPSSESSG
jgi:hypothetical protein